VTAKLLENIICELFAYVVNERGESGITSFPQLVQEQFVGGFTDWCINTREVKGESLRGLLRLLSAALHQHPSYKSMDLNWFKPLLDGLPTESKSESRKRKAEMFLTYKVLGSIPEQIRAGRRAAEKRGLQHVARVVQDELLFRWFITLPWRQRNVREMRIGGPRPNLYKGKIEPFSEIDKPKWVQEEERRNSTAEFWQFHFDADETKMKIEVDALLPRQLIGPLEEFLQKFRGRLIHGVDPGTLFVNQAGKPLTKSLVGQIVSTLTLRHGGRRVSPHPFRDIVAFTWLKEHPEDYLTLSKMLWHKNPQMVIEVYGSRFNESSGVCAMESWLEEREAKAKQKSGG
jgi:integrase